MQLLRHRDRMKVPRELYLDQRIVQLMSVTDDLTANTLILFYARRLLNIRGNLNDIRVFYVKDS